MALQRRIRTIRSDHCAPRGLAEKAVDSLVRYYAVESNYAGATFAGLEPQDDGCITTTDLLAVTTLSVEVPPLAIRRLTGESTPAQRAAEILRRLPTDLGIEHAEGHAHDMAQLYELVKSSLHRHDAKSSNAWVTASKICARKRPRLFPVRDTVVVKVVGLKASYPDDWPVFSALMADEELGQTIDALVEAANGQPGVDVGNPSLRLRHLDALLWMHGVGFSN